MLVIFMTMLVDKNSKFFVYLNFPLQESLNRHCVVRFETSGNAANF